MAQLGFWEGIARDLTGRGLLGGKFQLRLILQPLIATVLGIRFGLRDAKHGKPPFLMSLVEAKGEAKGDAKKDRLAILKQGLRDAIVPLCVALILDGILQRMTIGYIRPLAAVVVGTLLVFLPFVIVRGLTNRVWHHGHGQQVPHAP